MKKSYARSVILASAIMCSSVALAVPDTHWTNKYADIGQYLSYEEYCKVPGAQLETKFKEFVASLVTKYGADKGVEATTYVRSEQKRRATNLGLSNYNCAGVQNKIEGGALFIDESIEVLKK